MLSYDEALQQGLIDTTTMMVRDPKSGQLISMEEAVSYGILHSAPTVKEVLHETETTTTRKATVAGKVTDQEKASRAIMAPQHQSILDAEDLLDQSGLSDLSRQIDAETRRPSSSRSPGKSASSSPTKFLQLAELPPAVSYDEAMDKGMIDPVTMRVKDPNSGEMMTIEDAVKFGLLHSAPNVIEVVHETDTITTRKASVPGKVVEKPQAPMRAPHVSHSYLTCSHYPGEQIHREEESASGSSCPSLSIPRDSTHRCPTSG